jgi:hypothetical protein
VLRRQRRYPQSVSLQLALKIKDAGTRPRQVREPAARVWLEPGQLALEVLDMLVQLDDDLLAFPDRLA